MTQLSDKEHNAQMADMASFDEQMPCVGFFWYDPEDNTLFGVRKKELTPQMVEESRAKGVDVIDYPISSLLHQTSDIKQRECGRVAWTIDKFIVLVGKWAEPIKEHSPNCWNRSSPCRTSSSCTRSVLPLNWEERLPPRRANLLNPRLVCRYVKANRAIP